MTTEATKTYNRKRKASGYVRVSKWIHRTKRDELEGVVNILNKDAESERDAAIYEVTTKEWPVPSDTSGGGLV